MADRVTWTSEPSDTATQHEAQGAAVFDAGTLGRMSDTPVLCRKWACSVIWPDSSAMPMQDIAVFDNPKLDLEQYPTGPHLASRLLFTVN